MWRPVNYIAVLIIISFATSVAFDLGFLASLQKWYMRSCQNLYNLLILLPFHYSRTCNSAKDAHYIGLIWFIHKESVLAVIYVLCVLPLCLQFCLYSSMNWCWLKIPLIFSPPFLKIWPMFLFLVICYFVFLWGPTDSHLIAVRPVQSLTMFAWNSSKLCSLRIFNLAESI